MRPEEIWQQASEKIEACVNKQIHDTWFKFFSIDSIEGKEITFVAPN